MMPQALQPFPSFGTPHGAPQRLGMFGRGLLGAPRQPTPLGSPWSIDESGALPAMAGGIDLPQLGMSGASAIQPTRAAPPGKPKFFGQGGAGWDILGGLSEGLLVASGAQAQFGPQMARLRQQREQSKLEETRYQRERADRLADWQMQQQWKLDHPDDQFTQYLTAAGIDPTSLQGRALYRQRAESMAAPPLVAVDGFDAQGNRTKTFMPRNGVGTGGQAAPASPAIGTVRNGYRFQGGNPNDRNSWVPAGGASSGGGATFR